MADLPQTESTPEIRVDCPDAIKFKLVEELSQVMKNRTTIDLPGKSPLRIIDQSTIDGIRFRFESGWGLVRASNTQPALVLRFEAASKQDLESIRTGIEGILDEVKSKIQAS